MSPWEWVGIYTVVVLITLVGLFFALVLLTPSKPEPEEPKPCARCGLKPGDNPGQWRKPS